MRKKQFHHNIFNDFCLNKLISLTYCITKLKDFCINILQKIHMSVEHKGIVFDVRVQVMKKIIYRSGKVLK